VGIEILFLFGLRHFDCVEDFVDDFFGSQVVCFGFVREADAVTEDVVTYGANVFWDYVAASASLTKPKQTT
jgi:hypothetical protein